MADVFLTEDYDDSTKDKGTKSFLARCQELLNNDPSDKLNESPANDSSSMTLKEDSNESEVTTGEDQLVNPDDLLPPVVKLEKYANSEIVFNRQVVARNLLETLRLVQGNKEDVQRVNQVICSISEDYDPSVRTELMVQFPHIVAFFHNAELQDTVEDCLVPMMNIFLGDDNSNVRKACHSALLTIMEQELVNYSTISEKVSPCIIHLTHFLHPEELRCETIMLISKMIVLMGKKYAEKLFFERFFILCSDKANNIRKACASTFGDICTTVGQDITENILLPKFFTLCEDGAWCVRKACAENFMPVSCVVSREIRRKELSSLYMILLSDHSRWVRLTAFQALGPFISTFAEPDRTGLYYSKDGVLTVINYDQAHEKENNDKHTPICNGDTEEWCNDSAAEVDSRTISYEGVSSLCNIDTNLSTASDIPGISCQVGANHCTVIEVNLSSDVRCDLSTGDSWTAMDASNKSVTNNSNSAEETRSMNLWDEVVYDSSENCNNNEIVKSQLDRVNGEDKSTFLTVDEVNLHESFLSEPTNCQSTPFINSNINSCNDSSCKFEISSNETSSEAVENTSDGSMEMGACKWMQLKVSNDRESAFNHFQYWRDPLPEVEIDVDAYNGCSVSRFSTLAMKDKKPIRRRGFKNYKDIPGFTTWCKEVSEDKGEPPPHTPLLSPHEQDIVPPELLLQYLSMIDASWAQTIDAEIARHCAYSLPAVALTLGRQFWPCLKETFDALSSDLQGCIMMWKVRRTVASAMHQLAVILGPEITSKDLLPVFSRFINDLDEVRVGILQHLFEFLQVLHSEERNQFLPNLPQFLISNSDSDSNDKNWRFRLILAEQLVSIADLYEPLQVRKHLVPLSLTLIKDKVCEVRLAAVRVMAAVMKQFREAPVHSKAFLAILTENFVHSPKWLYRQLYVYICQQIILEKSLNPDQFAEDALPQLLYLCWDRVPNVRIAIARCLVVVIWPIEVFSNPESPHRELLLQTIHTLQSDTDADVRFYANMVSTHECSCLQNGEFPNAVEPYL